jgi:hypothetical protein
VSRFALFLLCFVLIPATAAQEPSPTTGSQAALKLLKQAERNLSEMSSWAIDVLRQSPTAISADHRTLLYRANSQTQRSARALALSAADDSLRGFVAEYQAFAEALRDLHRAVVLGEDPSELIGRSLVRAETALSVLKDNGMPESRPQSAPTPPQAALLD